MSRSASCRASRKRRTFSSAGPARAASCSSAVSSVSLGRCGRRAQAVPREERPPAGGAPRGDPRRERPDRLPPWLSVETRGARERLPQELLDRRVELRRPRTRTKRTTRAATSAATSARLAAPMATGTATQVALSLMRSTVHLSRVRGCVARAQGDNNPLTVSRLTRASPETGLLLPCGSGLAQGFARAGLLLRHKAL